MRDVVRRVAAHPWPASSTDDDAVSAPADPAPDPTRAYAAAPVAAAPPPGDTSEGAVQRSLQRSFIVSADMAHAVHPNYADRHELGHKPRMGDGLVIKHHCNQRYATTMESAALFREVGARAGLPCQEFTVRQDSACGSTIGPALSAALGARTVDVGVAQLSMHSIREMCGVADVHTSLLHYTAFFEGFSALDASTAPGDLPEADIRGVIDGVDCCDV